MISSNFLKNIGKNIRDARKEIGMKGETLAKELNISKAAISQMENGSMDFRISLLQNIAGALDTDVCNLLPLPVIKSPRDLKKIPSDQEVILVHRILIDELLSKILNKTR